MKSAPRALFLCLLVLLSVVPRTRGLYFYLRAGHTQCFLEELPKDTVVVGQSELSLSYSLLVDVVSN
jgi:hypothetical protein